LWFKVEGRIRPAEKACFLGHRALSSRVTRGRASTPVFILEDDAIFGSASYPASDNFLGISNSYKRTSYLLISALRGWERWRLVNLTRSLMGLRPVNHKRMYRVMKDQGLLLPKNHLGVVIAAAVTMAK
jgi:hypothetical protein